MGLGILVEAKIARLEGCLSEADYEKVAALIQALGVQPNDLENYTFEQIEAAMQLDKKAQGKTVKMVMLTGLGSVLKNEAGYTHPLKSATLKQALQSF